MAATLQKTKPPLLSAPAPSGSGPASSSSSSSSSSITSLFRGPGRFTPSVAPVLMTPTGLLVSVDEGLGNGHPVRSLKAEELLSPPNDDTQPNNIKREAKGEDTTGGEQEEGGGTTTTTTTRTTTTGTENYPRVVGGEGGEAALVAQDKADVCGDFASVAVAVAVPVGSAPPSQQPLLPPHPNSTLSVVCTVRGGAAASLACSLSPLRLSSPTTPQPLQAATAQSCPAAAAAPGSLAGRRGPATLGAASVDSLGGPTAPAPCWRRVGLFGGAMEVRLPGDWEDVSRLRQVPDHQEVWRCGGGGGEGTATATATATATPGRVAVLVVEVLSRAGDVPDSEAGEFFLGDLANREPTALFRARNCDLLGKEPNRKARVVTFSHIRNKKVQHVNLQIKRYASKVLGRVVKLRISTKGIKTVAKYDGDIDAAAKKFGVDLGQFR
ncbi:hypothetical protein ScalyP_jg768 [Parmales sp. scaly parma]|nr:hypothetical protein ScalyP_jg768 [Parmales sp. scaly parma]